MATPASIERRFAAAVRLHDAGDENAAADAYEQLLAEAPDHAAALTNLGQLKRALGLADQAAALYRRAIAAPGSSHHAWFNLGNLMLDSGAAAAAERCFQAVLVMAPESADGVARLASALRDAGALEAAETWFARALGIRWEQPLVHLALGTLHRRAGRLQEAYARHRVALRLAPGTWEVRYNLAQTMIEIGDGQGAAEQLRLAVRAAPRPGEVHASFGVFLASLRAHAPAAARFRRALVLAPNNQTSLNGLARCRVALGVEGGPDWFNAAGVLAAGDPAALSALATAEWESGPEERAAERLRQAATLLPDDTDARQNLARALRRLWRADGWSQLGVVLTTWSRIEAALRAHETARLIEPDNLDYISSQAFASLYSDRLTSEEKAALHRWLAAMIEQTAPPVKHSPPGTPAIQGGTRVRARLRIGYLSPDLAGRHPVAVLSAPLFAYHDPTAFEIHGFSSAERPDAATARLRAHCASWHDIAGADAAAVARAIQDKGIDILVDLAGHTAGNRLNLMARRPAPVQAGFIGYPHSSGLAAIDTLIADPIVCPPSLDPLGSETVSRLPHCVFCLDPSWSTVPIDPRGVETRRNASTAPSTTCPSSARRPSISGRHCCWISRRRG
jgi:protein O-GlcNAc transferase